MNESHIGELKEVNSVWVFISTLFIATLGGSDVWLKNTKNFADYLTSLQYPFVNQVGTDAVGAHAMGYWQYHLGSYADWYSAHLPSPY